MFKTISTLIGLLLSFQVWAESDPVAAKSIYPRVAAVQGEIFNFYRAQKIKLKEKETLIEKALIEVGPKSKMRLELDEKSSVILYENTKLEIPVITWGEGEIPDLILQSGTIRYNCEKNCKRRLSTQISSEVFTNAETLLTYDSQKPQVELTVLHGEQYFRGLENEEGVQVAAGTKALFQGLKENNEIAFDILLKSRKVARGKLLPLVKLSMAELSELEQKTRFQKSVMTPAQKQALMPKPGEICSKPFAQLNQCVWVCEGATKGLRFCDTQRAGVRCVRSRCNANGAWSDTQIQSGSSLCEIGKKIVASCDY